MNDIKNAIKSVEFCEGTSKSGTKYYYIRISLINNGEERIFLNNDSKFKWDNAVQMLENK